ncbi:divergent PAP2 family protein [Patescibacteria group bacterium]|nr:divergent PAP2 family protein [Patescibacteria group bacterium]
MEAFIIKYLVLICPIVAFTLAQGTKIIIRSTKRKLNYRDIFAYSDMPSGHTAVVVALVTIIALVHGISSSFFSIAFVFAVIVIVDAIGLRNYLGQHGKTLNVLVKDLHEDSFLDFSYPKLLEKIGHTPLQVLVGALVGIATSLLGYFLFIS